MRVSEPQVKRVMLPMPTRQWVNGREEIMILLATRSSIRKMEASCCCCCSSSSFQPPAIQSSPGRLPPTHGLIFFRPRALKMFRKPGSNVDQVVTAPPRCTEMCKKKKLRLIFDPDHDHGRRGGENGRQFLIVEMRIVANLNHSYASVLH